MLLTARKRIPGGFLIASATILMVRHAAHTQLGRVLSGRAPGIELSPAGREQARRLGAALAGEPLAAVHSSPVLRARSTAAALERDGVVVEPVEALTEIDFGSWTGVAFDRLEGDPAWREWNEARARATPPRGEAMAAAQARVMDHLRATAAVFTGRVVAMVSHCDLIRAAVAGVLGLSLDRILRFEIDPASVTRIVAGPWGEKLLSLNERPA